MTLSLTHPNLKSFGRPFAAIADSTDGITVDQIVLGARSSQRRMQTPKGVGSAMNMAVVTVTAMATLTVTQAVTLSMVILMVMEVVAEMAGLVCTLSQVLVSSMASQRHSITRTCFVLQSQWAVDYLLLSLTWLQFGLSTRHRCQPNRFLRNLQGHSA